MNPYGNNNGYAGGFLGNMTAGVEAIQATERNRLIRDIEQQKNWQHDEKLRNEKFIMEIGSTPVVNDLRIGVAKQAATEAEQMMSELTDFSKNQNNMSFEQKTIKKTELLTKMKEVQARNQNAKLFIDAVEQMPQHIEKVRGSLQGEDRELFDQGLVEFRTKMADPEASKNLTPYDAMLALQPKFGVVTEMRQFIKGRSGILEPDSKLGAKEYNPEATTQMLASELQANKTLTQKINQRYGVVDLNDVNSAAKIMEENFRSDLSKGFTPGKIPTRGGGGSGKLTEKNTFLGVVDRVESAAIDGKPTQTFDKAYKVTAWGRPVPVSTKDGIGDFTPKYALPNGMVQGVVKIPKETVGKEDEFSKIENAQLDSPNSRIDVTEYAKDGITPVKARLVTKTVIEKTTQVPYSDNKEVLEALDPDMAAFMDEYKDQKPRESIKEIEERIKSGKLNVFTNVQETGIKAVMKANGVSREEAISALKQAGKLK
jgi:NACalpha-BTF3-like transcription factor